MKIIEYKSGQATASDIPLVLIHGWGTSSLVWQDLIACLKAKFDIIVIDLPGFGNNAKVRAENFETLVEKLTHALPSQCYLLGWSLGGMLATQIAAKCTEKVVKLITIASNPCFVESDRWPTAMLENTYQQFIENFKSDPASTFSRFILLQSQGDSERKLVSARLKSIQKSPEEFQLQSWQVGLDWLKQIQNDSVVFQLSQPALHLFGENDQLVPASAALAIQERQPDGAIILEKTGHVPHVSQPEEVAKEIKTFLLAGVKRDKKDVASSFSRAAKQYDKVAKLQKQVADEVLKLNTEYSGVIADIGCGTGYCSEQLRHRADEIVGIDISPGMLDVAREKNIPNTTWVCGDMEKLQLKNESVDGIISSLSIQWSENLSASFAEMYRILKPGGWVAFSTLGPETLHELRDSWKKINRYVHVNRFDPLSDVSRLIEENGFHISKSIQKNIALQYDCALELMRELKAIGAHNVNRGKNAGLTTRGQISALEKHYETYRDETGKLPATYETYFFLLRKN